MSDTPRTDAVAEQCVGEGSPMSYVRAIDLCRKLERECNYYADLAKYIEGCHAAEQEERKRLEALVAVDRTKA